MHSHSKFEKMNQNDSQSMMGSKHFWMQFLSTNKNGGETEHSKYNMSQTLCLLQTNNVSTLWSTVLVMRMFLAERLYLDQRSIPCTTHETWLGEHPGRAEALPAAAGGGNSGTSIAMYLHRQQQKHLPSLSSFIAFRKVTVLLPSAQLKEACGQELCYQNLHWSKLNGKY